MKRPFLRPLSWLVLLSLAACRSTPVIPAAPPMPTAADARRVFRERFLPETRVVVEGRGRFEGRGSVRFLLFLDAEVGGVRLELSPLVGSPLGVLVIDGRRWAWRGREETRQGEVAATVSSDRHPDDRSRWTPTGRGWRLSFDGGHLDLDGTTGLPVRVAWEGGELELEAYRRAGRGYLPGWVHGTLPFEDEPIAFELRWKRVTFPEAPFPPGAFELRAG